jgi:hypothetical protein
MEAVVSGLIGGVFTLTGIWYTHHLQNQQRVLQFESSSAAGQSTGSVGGLPPAAMTLPVNLGAVLRDVGIIWLLTAAAGVMLGIAMVGVTDPDAVLAAMGFGNIIFGTIAFVISGARAGRKRWKHLWAVALMQWVSALINIPLIDASIGQWILALPLLMIMMSIGGAFSYLFNRE